jgi:SAM-dependent methyltransferase
MPKLGDRFLNLIAVDTNGLVAGATARYTLDNCLDFVQKTIHNFRGRISGRRVLDFGCGHGWQSIAMARLGAAQVLGLDVVTERFDGAWELARQYGVSERVRFSDSGEGFQPDVVVSIGGFEHFADPQATLNLMASLAQQDGEILVTWACPWFSPNGSHVNGFTRIPGTDIAFPWLNLLVPEPAMMRLRSRYRSDGASRYEEVTGGLNRMTLAKFERIVGNSGLVVSELQYFGVKGLPLVTRVPILRELLTSAVSCVLRHAAH